MADATVTIPWYRLGAGATAGVGKKIAAGRVARKARGAALDGSRRAQLA